MSLRVERSGMKQSQSLQFTFFNVELLSNNQPLGINSLPETSPPTSSVSPNGVNQPPILGNADA